ncbi:hypothetical protein BD779DRAFT_1556684 [Infundibulicybe gibba]|nr:hypothetical protein BD779DRAFT_1556684 [Infundibulicybe gibba]
MTTELELYESEYFRPVQRVTRRPLLRHGLNITRLTNESILIPSKGVRLPARSGPQNDGGIISSERHLERVAMGRRGRGYDPIEHAHEGLISLLLGLHGLPISIQPLHEVALFHNALNLLPIGSAPVRDVENELKEFVDRDDLLVLVDLLH